MNNPSSTRLLALRGVTWPVVLAVLGGSALLLAFQHVVHGVVDQGAMRRQAVALHADATWRCRIERAAGDSRNCLAQLQLPERAGPP